MKAPLLLERKVVYYKWKMLVNLFTFNIHSKLVTRWLKHVLRSSFTGLVSDYKPLVHKHSRKINLDFYNCSPLSYLYVEVRFHPKNALFNTIYLYYSLPEGTSRSNYCVLLFETFLWKAFNLRITCPNYWLTMFENRFACTLLSFSNISLQHFISGKYSEDQTFL